VFGNKILFAIVLGIAVFLEGSIPFWYADRKADSDHAFLGQVAYPMDQDMYFSFISQAKEGHWIFYNKLTYSPNKPVFINLEFLLVGFIQRVFRLSENAVYQTWRLIGAIVLTLGFYVLAVLILPTIKQARVATAVFLFTGGFGFLFASLSGSHLIGADAAQSGTLDMRYGLLPFQQVLSNPHFSLAHGLILLAYALFLLAEKQNRIENISDRKVSFR